MIHSLPDQNLVRIFAYTGPLGLETVCRKWYSLIRSDRLYGKILSIIRKTLERHPYRRQIHHLIRYSQISPAISSQDKEVKHIAIFNLFTRLKLYTKTSASFGVLGFHESLLTFEWTDLNYLVEKLKPVYGEFLKPEIFKGLSLSERVLRATEMLMSLQKPKNSGALTLDLSHHRILFINPLIFSNLEISTINISKCNLSFIPDYVFAAKRITYLSLRENKITGLPDEFLKLESLESLDIGMTSLSMQDPKIQFLRNNKSLKIINNL